MTGLRPTTGLGTLDCTTTRPASGCLGFPREQQQIQPYRRAVGLRRQLGLQPAAHRLFQVVPPGEPTGLPPRLPACRVARQPDAPPDRVPLGSRKRFRYFGAPVQERVRIEPPERLPHGLRAVRNPGEMGAVTRLVPEDRLSGFPQRPLRRLEGPVGGEVDRRDFPARAGAPLRLPPQRVPEFTVARRAVEERLDVGARLAAGAVVVQHPLRRQRGSVGNARGFGKRAGRVDDGAPALEIERKAVPSPGLLQDRSVHFGECRPGRVVLPERVEPVDRLPDLRRRLFQRVEMGLPCSGIVEHGPPASSGRRASVPPAGMGIEGRGGIESRLRFQRASLLQQPGGVAVERPDVRAEALARLRVGDRFIDNRPEPFRQAGKFGERPRLAEEFAVALGMERNRPRRFRPLRDFAAQRLEREHRVVEIEQGRQPVEPPGDRARRLRGAYRRVRQHRRTVRPQPVRHAAPFPVFRQTGHRPSGRFRRRVQRAPPPGQFADQAEELLRRLALLPAGAVVGLETLRELPGFRRQVRRLRKPPRALDQRPVPFHKEQHRPVPPRPLLQRPPLLERRPRRLLLRYQGRQLRVARGDPFVHRLQPRRALAGIGLQHLDQLLAVVGQYLRPVPRPADLDIEGRLVGQRAVARIENRDHPVRRRPLGAVHRRAPGMVDMGAAADRPPAQRDRPPVRKVEPHAVARDLRSFRPSRR